MTRIAPLAIVFLVSGWAQDLPKPAEEVYKNIQIMKGVPAPRIMPVMQNLTKWLGVDCAYCHVPGEFERVPFGAAECPAVAERRRGEVDHPRPPHGDPFTTSSSKYRNHAGNTHAHRRS